MKDIYNNFKESEYFYNLSKSQKRSINYKHFVANLQTNIFLKKHVKEDANRVLVMKGYKLIVEDTTRDKRILPASVDNL